jgi:MFS family permease
LFGTATVFIVFAPLYLTHRGLSLIATGNIVSGWGLGGVIGAVALPLVFDPLGRKRTGVLALILGAAGVLLFANTHNAGLLFLAAVVVGLFIQGAIPLYLILIAGETIPDRMRARATAVVNFGITTIGGGVFALCLGGIGQAFGMRDTIMIGVAFGVVGALLTLGIRETAPRWRTQLD